ncbi:MAG: hypothetical protein R3D55_09030 [Chloroflexota bacterium]
MPHLKRRNTRFFLFLIGGAILLTLTLGLIFHLNITLVTVLLVVQGLIFAALWLWHQANRQATGSEWWQDDEASGWRGY